MDYYIFRNCLMEDKLYIMAGILTHWPVVRGPPLLGIMFSTTVPVQEFKDCYLHRMAHT